MAKQFEIMGLDAQKRITRMERLHRLCVAGELDSKPGRTSSGRSHGLYVTEELGPMCDGGEIVRFKPI